MVVSHDFFSTPDKLNSYWAGFIAADGCVNTGRNRVEIVTHNSDRVHLEQLRDLVSPENPIEFRKDGCVRLTVTSKQWKEDLNKHFNVTPAKSLTLQPPNLTKISHIKAFIAGYLDGDGHVGYKGSGNWQYLRVEIVGTKAVLEWMNVHLPGPGNIRAKENIYTLDYSNMKAFAVHNYLWNPQLPILNRKWDDKLYKRPVDNRSTGEYTGKHRLDSHVA